MIGHVDDGHKRQLRLLQVKRARQDHGTRPQVQVERMPRCQFRKDGGSAFVFHLEFGTFAGEGVENGGAAQPGRQCVAELGLAQPGAALR